jgi:hypothetical protein
MRLVEAWKGKAKWRSRQGAIRARPIHTAGVGRPIDRQQSGNLSLLNKGYSVKLAAIGAQQSREGRPRVLLRLRCCVGQLAMWDAADISSWGVGPPNM